MFYQPHLIGLPRDDHDLFYRAMWAPELEQIRQRQEREYVQRMDESERISRKMSGVLRINELRDEMGERAMQICIRLTPLEFHSMRGNAQEFAMVIATDLIEKMGHVYIWGDKK